MRKTAVAIALVLVASLGIIVPSVAATTGDPKVVIIVGATGSVTPAYRADADVAYAEAIRYTSNVVRVYSPNATWATVKAAAAGASVVIYMGHGNGWPSPYGNDAAYTTKDGFGLNATAGAGDDNNTYYGEPSIATLGLAPGAIVLLHHLCYASGNSEPGSAEATVTVARQRADNYAAGFLKAGAAAVIADGRTGAEGYLRRIFTTHQSIEDLWRAMPNQNGNVVSFPSVRTPGATVYQDPITPSSGFYRSLAIGSLAGNASPALERTVDLSGALRSVATSKSIFFPQDLDALARTTTLSFVLARPMTVSWTLRDAAGQTVDTHLSGVDLPAGTQTWTFDGRRSDGTMLPRGRYVSYVTATDGAQVAAQSVAFEMDAFLLNLIDTTPRRGRSITVTVISAESLLRAPRLYIYQPGVARWSVILTWVATDTYRATIRMKTSRRPGPVSLRVWGRDVNGGSQATTKVYPLH